MIPRFPRRGRRVRNGTILPERQNSTPGRALICAGDVGRGASLDVAAIPAALPPAGGGGRAMAAVQHSAHGLPPAGAGAALPGGVPRQGHRPSARGGRGRALATAYPAGMTFSIPDDLAPELYPLAWLVGTWRGYGILTYGQTVPEQAVAQEMTFDHDGGPYLRQTTTIWTLDATRSSDLDFDTPGLEGFARIAPARIWSTETAYWRPVGQDEPDGEGGSPGGPGAASADRPDGAGTDGPGSGGGAASMGGPGDSDGPASGAASSNRPDGARPRTAPRTRLELVSADPAGHVAVWEGWIRGPRAQIGTQAVGRTRTAVPLTQMNRMFGLVGGDLMWTQDMAAFGETEPKTYASGRLGRVQGPDAAGIAVPAGTAAAEASAVPAAGADAPSAPDARAAGGGTDRRAQS